MLVEDRASAEAELDERDPSRLRIDIRVHPIGGGSFGSDAGEIQRAIRDGFPPPPSERRRHRRVCLGEPPATVAIPLDEAALGQSAEPHGDRALVAAGCLRPLHDASLRIVAHCL